MTVSTIKRIAELCGVSRGTVDRVLNGRPGVNARTAARVREVAARQGYQPNAVGRALFGLRNPIRIGVILPPDHQFVSGLKRGLADAARELAPLGIRIDVRSMTVLEPRDQVELLEAVVRDGARAIALLPIESPEVVRTVGAIIEAGVPVVTFNSDLPEVDRLCFVGQDHLAGGRVAGGLMGRMVGAGQVAVITTSHHLLCHVQRRAGFAERLLASHPGVEVVATVENEDRDDLAQRSALSLLRTFPDLRGIYLTGGGAAGLGRALRQARAAERVRVVTHDFVPDTVRLVRAGVIDFAIGQDPEAQGYLPIQILHAHLSRGERPPTAFVPTRIEIRTLDNIDGGGRAQGAGEEGYPAAAPEPPAADRGQRLLERP